jgi:hypothetical protein
MLNCNAQFKGPLLIEITLCFVQKYKALLSQGNEVSSLKVILSSGGVSEVCKPVLDCVLLGEEIIDPSSRLCKRPEFFFQAGCQFATLLAQPTRIPVWQTPLGSSWNFQ